MVGKPPFHLALPVADLDATRTFYTEHLGCSEGRAAETWIDFDFFGHQISFHLASTGDVAGIRNAVDGVDVPIPHFGAVLPPAEWRALADRLRELGAAFVVERPPCYFTTIV